MSEFQPCYTCEACGEHFQKVEENDERAEIECQALFPDLREEDRHLVCDDCFNEMFVGPSQH